MAHCTILFVDDDVLTQWTMSEALAGNGYEVVSLCRGSEAVELLESEPDFDLLLTEIDLPDAVDGTQLGSVWRQQTANRPVIYTGSSRGFAFSRIHQSDIFLEKPFSVRRLLDLVTSAIQDIPCRRPVCGSVSRRDHVN